MAYSPGANGAWLVRFRHVCLIGLLACKRPATNEQALLQEPRLATSIVAGLSDVSSSGEVFVAESSGLEQPLQPLVSLGRCAVTAPDAWTVLELRSGARFKIESNSRACVLNYAPKALFVIEGSVVAEVPQTSTVEVRVITDHGSVVVGSGGQVWFAQQHALGNGADTLVSQGYVAVLREHATLERRAPEGSGASEVLNVGREVGFGLPIEGKPRATAAEARRAYDSARGQGGAALIPVSSADGALEDAVSTAEHTVGRGAELWERWKRAKSQDAEDELAALNREFREEAARQLQLKRSVKRPLEQSLIGVLSLCAAQPKGNGDCSALKVWMERFDWRAGTIVTGIE